VYPLSAQFKIKKATETTKMRILIDLFCAPRFSRLFAVLIFLAELVFNYGLVRYRKYTEIDWKAYMQEVEGYLNGSTNYM
jgi:alpha-1,3-mannosyltransferase